MLVGYVDIVRELEIRRVLFEGAIRPSYRRQGIATRLLQRAMEHGQGLEADRVHIPFLERMSPASRLVERHGFSIARRHWRMRLSRDVNLPRAGLPPGFELRHFISGDEQRLTQIQNIAFEESWGFKPNTVAEVRYWVGFFRSEGIIFATLEDEVEGYCWARASEGDIWMMGVHPKYQRRGLGYSLLLAGIDSLRRQGVGEIELTVDSQNLPAIDLYRRVGFQKKEEILLYEKTLEGMKTVVTHCTSSVESRSTS